jgi:nucleoside-diphosphate-sugar epimerase
VSATPRVLVTGASGFIGRRALPALAERGFDVHAVSSRAHAPGGAATWHRADLLDPVARREVVAAVAPTHLLHLAWYAEPGAFWDARQNAPWVAATIDLLDAFAAAGGTRAVLAGTCAEYDWERLDGPIAEDAPIAPATFYGRAKHATHEVAGGLAARAGVALAWGRIFFLYGPEEDERRLVADVASKLVRGEAARTSAGTQRRDFLFVDDVAGAFAALVASDVEGPVNVASGRGPAVREIVEAIGRAAGATSRLEVGALPMREGDPPEIVADVRRLRDEVGFVPATGLDEGIAATVAWWAARLRRG